MEETEYGPDPEEVRVFDFGNDTLQDMVDAVEIHDEVHGERYQRDAKRHLGEAAYNAKHGDAMLGLLENKLQSISDILREVGEFRILGHRFENARFRRLSDEFERQMDRADTAAEVGPEHVETERY